MLSAVVLIYMSGLVVEIDSIPKKCLSEGITCQPINNDCCEGLTCVASGDDGTRRCFRVELGVDFVEEEVSFSKSS
jgi:hypothetical protein